jgi:hypothetical protein
MERGHPLAGSSRCALVREVCLADDRKGDSAGSSPPRDFSCGTR